MQNKRYFYHRPPAVAVTGWRWPGAHRRWRQLIIALLLVFSGVGFALPRPAYAAAITADGTTCTLIDALTAANTDTAVGTCPAGSGFEQTEQFSYHSQETSNRKLK